jgi:peroxiredoxin
MHKGLNKQMKKNIVFFIFCLVPLYAQTLSIEIANVAPSQSVKLYLLRGERISIVDSNITIAKSEFSKYHIMIPLPAQYGFYRLSFSPSSRIDFVNDGKDVVLQSDAKNILDSMKVITSESNKLFYSFIRLGKSYKTKTELLQLILARYPQNDSYYSATKKRLNELQSEYTEFVNVTSQKEPDSFIAQYIRSAQLPVVDGDLPIDKQLVYLKAHALDNVDFNNSKLVNSDVFTNKTIEYLTYFRNPQLPKELLEKEFCSAIDSILNRAKINGIVYQHIVEYLIDGFKRFGFDNVLDYIVNNYVIKDDLCLDVKTEGMIKRRIDQAKYLKIGAVAPNFALFDLTGKALELDKCKANKTLLVFYSTQCPHCQEIMPKLNSIYPTLKAKDIKIIAVCLETKKEEWEKFVKDKCPDLINVSDLKGWDGQVANGYYLYATPTMIILDKDRKIIGKPMTLEEITSQLK